MYWFTILIYCIKAGVLVISCQKLWKLGSETFVYFRVLIESIKMETSGKHAIWFRWLAANYWNNYRIYCIYLVKIWQNTIYMLWKGSQMEPFTQCYLYFLSCWHDFFQITQYLILKVITRILNTLLFVYCSVADSVRVLSWDS